MLTDLPFDLVILLLRVIFIFLLYFFLFQVMRVVSRELRAVPTPAGRPVGGGVMPTLTVVEAKQSTVAVGTTFGLQPVTTVGRASDNTVVLPDAFISSHHAQVVRQNGRWFLTDLGSTNGSAVNGRRCDGRATPLKDGDIVQFGRLKMRLALA